MELPRNVCNLGPKLTLFIGGDAGYQLDERVRSKSTIYMGLKTVENDVFQKHSP
jgi:hypothetical protein